MKETIDKILYDQYLDKIRRRKRFVLLTQILIFLLFITLWEIASRSYFINPLIFSSPTNVIQLLAKKLLDGSLLYHLRYTIFETVLGFILGTIGGIVMASLLWSSKKLAAIADPYLVVFNAMPKVALGPMLIVALGPGMFSIIMMGAVISVIITTLVVYTSFMEVNPNYIAVVRSFGASRFTTFKEVVFPASLPTMISTLKVNVGLSWVGVIVGEFLVSNKGLGYLIIYGFQIFDFTLVMASLVIIAILAAMMYLFVERLERFLMKRLN
ncbi:MAG TPA: ABC transporter permease [Pseudogracilibacillus sp.]|nr:ABC transporter permease [Pseudogracilibacillus sp.]